MEILIIAAVLGLIPAFIANSKGRSFGLWWVYGLLLFIIALIHSIIIKKDQASIERSQLNEGLVKCPFCAEMIKPEAIKCKHCGSDVPKSSIKQGNDIDYGFLPSSIPVERYIRDDNGAISINGNEVVAMVKKLKKINAGAHPINIQARYSDDIDLLKDKLPIRLRDEFSMVYKAVLMD